jgi:undecaprenyl-diphosphatase
MLAVALLLGLIEGLTEFLPVSSTGHLILFGDILGFQGPAGKTFEIVIQLGAILAVCVLYWRKIFSITQGVFSRKPGDVRFAAGIILATLPALLLGAIFHRFIQDVLFSPVVVSWALIIGGIVILLAERFRPVPRVDSMESISPFLCLKIGFCQCLALIPGTSRSGATIIGAMLLGVDRKVATEFSFFLAIPIMIAATVFDLATHWEKLNPDDIELIAAGFIAAFLSALVVVRAVVVYVSKHGFEPFAWYRIALGTLMLYLLRA